MTSQDLLQQAAQYVSDGKPAEARAILIDLIRENPDKAEAWYLVSFVTTQPAQQINALTQALTLQPGHVRARNRLQHIRGTVTSE